MVQHFKNQLMCPAALRLLQGFNGLEKGLTYKIYIKSVFFTYTLLQTVSTLKDKT